MTNLTLMMYIALTISMVISVVFAVQIETGSAIIYYDIDKTTYSNTIMNGYAKRQSYTGKKFFIAMTMLFATLLLL